MRVQRVAVAPAQQRGAVVDLVRQTFVRKRGRCIGQRGKPGTKRGAVGRRMQTQKVRRAIVEAITGISDKMQQKEGRPPFIP